MNLRLVIPFLFLSACAGFNSSNEAKKEITFETLQKFKIGTSVFSEFIKVFGSQVTKVEHEGYYTINYFKPENGFQRVSANFKTANNVLTGFLWIPHPDEKELSLVEAKNKYKSAEFKEIPAPDPKTHVITDVVFLRDEKLGVTIRYDKISRTVEAIGQHKVVSRLPAIQTQ